MLTNKYDIIDIKINTNHKNILASLDSDSFLRGLTFSHSAIITKTNNSFFFICFLNIIEKLFFIQSAAKGAQDGVPIDAHTALQQPLILPNPEHGLRARIEAIAARENLALDVVLDVDILTTMLAFVERGLGGTILPLVSVLQQVRDKKLVARPIERSPIDRTLVLMSPLNRPSSRLTTSIAEFITAEVHQMVTAGEWPGTTL